MSNTNKPAVKQTEIVDSVTSRIQQLEQTGGLKTPPDYVPENALRAAYLILQDTKTKEGKNVLEHCTKDSIANSLFNMVVQGLTPLKRQGSFIAYGNQLSWQREYAGNIALARRFANLKEAVGTVIYEDDVFEYSLDPVRGRTTISKHEQKLENIDPNKIKGVYATLLFHDDTEPYIEIMTMAQVKQAWMQGPMKGNSPAHKNFPDQMAVKTVINRACKLFINSSDDSGMLDDSEEPVRDISVANRDQEIEENANQEELNVNEHIEEAQEVEVEPTQEAPSPNKDGEFPEMNFGE